MITLNENASRLAHDLIIIDMIAFILLAVSAVITIPLLIIGYMGAPMGGSKATKIPIVILACIASIIFLVSITLGLITVFADPYRYSGSANYKVEQVKTQSSGKQVIVVNDGKNDVDIKVDDDKISYFEGDKVKIVVRSNKSNNAGKHYLSSIKRSDLISPDVFSANYAVKKID